MPKKRPSRSKRPLRKHVRAPARAVRAKPAPPPPRLAALISDDADDLAPISTTLLDAPGDSVPTVVGVGASAGGLEAFSQLIELLPADSRLAIVFVQHLSPQHESALPELLASKTRLPVVQVVEGMHVERGHIHVIPPNVQMTVKDGVLHLSERTIERGVFSPVDQFFETLASWAQSRAIGVILSGTASDGAVGIRDIKAAGGITIAQAPATAKFDGMPRAAIATGLVDLVLTPAEIAEQLTQIERHPYVAVPPPAGQPPVDLTPDQLDEIFSMLRRISGVDFRQYKSPTIRRRLLRRMALRRVRSIDDYLRQLRDEPQELQAVYRDFLIHVTRFFREPDSFEALAREVLPEIAGERPHDDPVRIWVPGCSTGEEAYSVAIAMSEAMELRNASRRVQVFATDVSETAVDHARNGVYPASIQADVSPERLRHFFVASDGGFRVSKAIREMCVFARHDLTRDPPFSRLDLIVCRNVMIYLEPALQRRLIRVFHYGLKAHGFLMLGPAETPGAQPMFQMVDKKWRIFRKVAVESALPAEFTGDQFTPGPAPVASAAPRPGGESRSVQDEASRLLLQKYGPPGVVVDENLQVVHFRGTTGAFLEPAAGEPNLNVLKMAREGLLFPLRGAIQVARRGKRAVRKEGVTVRRNGSWHRINLEVTPLGQRAGGSLLIVFEEADGDGRGARAPKTPRRREPASRINERLATLTSELAASREYMQSIIQELEAANEELQSANEEILSSNEELQSTNEELDTAKEELQSTNEELNTLNDELHSRNEELGRVNSDLVNLLATVDLTIVIVGNDMRIRRFTPLAERVLNLIPGDIGRPLGQINTNLEIDSLEDLTRQTVDTITPLEREIRDRNGKWYSLRIRPYRNIDNRIEGAVVTLVDIAAVKELRDQVERLQQEGRAS